MDASDYRVRRATAADDFDLGELLVEAFVSSYARKMPEVVVSEERRDTLRNVEAKRRVATVWVAELKGRTVGTVAVWPPGSSGSEAFVAGAADLRHLAVARAHTGKRVSGLLLDAAEAWARSAGASGVCLHVRRGATGVRALYERRGYLRRPEGDLDRTPDVYLEGFYLAF